MCGCVNPSAILSLSNDLTLSYVSGEGVQSDSSAFGFSLSGARWRRSGLLAVVVSACCLTCASSCARSLRPAPSFGEYKPDAKIQEGPDAKDSVARFVVLLPVFRRRRIFSVRSLLDLCVRF